MPGSSRKICKAASRPQPRAAEATQDEELRHVNRWSEPDRCEPGPAPVDLEEDGPSVTSGPEVVQVRMAVQPMAVDVAAIELAEVVLVELEQVTQNRLLGRAGRRSPACSTGRPSAITRIRIRTRTRPGVFRSHESRDPPMLLRRSQEVLSDRAGCRRGPWPLPLGWNARHRWWHGLQKRSGPEGAGTILGGRLRSCDR